MELKRAGASRDYGDSFSYLARSSFSSLARRSKSSDSSSGSDDDDKSGTLLSALGARTINALCCVLFLIILFCVVYTIVVLKLGLVSCSQDISGTVTNPWFILLGSDLAHLSGKFDLSLSHLILRNHLEASALNMGKSLGGEGRSTLLLPWCSWCAVEEQLEYQAYYTKTTSTRLVEYFPTGTNPETAATDWLLTFILSQPTDIGDSCSSQLSLALLQALRAQLYPTHSDHVLSPAFARLLGIPISLNPYHYKVDINATNTTNPVGANASSPEYLQPCGDLVLMGLERVGSYVEGKPLPHLVDTLHGDGIVQANETYLLYSRCISLSVRAFLDECVIGPEEIEYPSSDGTRWSALFPFDPDHKTDLDPLQFKLAPNKPKRDGTDSNDIDGEFSLFGGLNRSNVSSDWVGAMQKLETLLAESDPGEALAFCSSLTSPLDMVIIDGSLSGSATPMDLSLCWVLYSLHFYLTEKCLPRIVGFDRGTNATFPQSSLSSEWLLDAQVLPLLIHEVQSERDLPQGTTFSDGYSSFPLTKVIEYNENRTSDDSKLGPKSLFSREIFEKDYAPCMRAQESAAKSLQHFRKFLTSMETCKSVAAQVKTSNVLELVLFCIVLVLFVVHVVVYGICAGSPWALSQGAMVLGCLFLCDMSWWVFDLDSVYPSTNLLVWGIFTNTPTWPSTESYSSPASALGLALVLFSNLAFVDRHCLNLASKNHANVRKDDQASNRKKFESKLVYYATLCVAYFLMRWLVVGYCLNADPGWVPFVNLITVGRTCALPEVSPLPRCNSPDMEGSVGVLPFYGNLLACVCDAGALVVTLIAQKRAYKAIESAPFSVAREGNLLLCLRSLIVFSGGFAIFFCGLLYCSLVNIRVGTYSGYIDFSFSGIQYVGLSLSYTGVQFWTMGFTLIWFFVTLGLELIMWPRSSSFFRVMEKYVLSNSQLAVREILEEKHFRRKFHRSLFDPRLFCVETQLNAFLSWHASYHIGVYYDEGSAFLPDGVRQVAYIFDQVTDTHVFITRKGKRLYVAFRGTASTKNAKTDLNLNLSAVSFEDLSGQDTPRGSSLFRNSKDLDELNGAPGRSNMCDERASNSSEQGHDRSALVLLDKQTREAIHDFQAQGYKPKCHGGFLAAFRSVQERVLRSVVLETEDGASEIVCCGHSLGGGLATICAVYLGAASKTYEIMLSTWGCPRVGNRDFVGLVNLHCPASWRIVTRGDPIVKTPPKFPFGGDKLNLGFCHVGITCLLDLENLVVDPTMQEQLLLHSLKGGGMFFHKSSGYGANMLNINLKAGVVPQIWLNSRRFIGAYTESFLKQKPAYNTLATFLGSHDDDEEQATTNEEVVIDCEASSSHIAQL